MSAHHKMMGRGADGGCGTQEKPCPISRPPARALTPCRQTLEPVAAAVDLLAQAGKALSHRSPFDASEEALSRVPTLPVSLSDFLSRPSGDSRRRKHKKSHSVPGAQNVGRNIWADTDEYFRPVALAEIESLASKCAIGSPDSCFLIPSPVQDTVVERNVVSEDLGSCETAVQIGGLERVTVVEELHNEEQGMDQRMEIDGGVDTDAVQHEEKENDSSASLMVSFSSLDLHWLLGSKHKVLLTSERPSKKRKLLGEEAGLERLISIHPSQREDITTCDVCCLCDTGDQSNRFILCESCNVAIHQNCYGIRNFPTGRWFCSWCKKKDCLETGSSEKPVQLPSRPCLLCPKEGGALKPVGGDSLSSRNGSNMKFAHLFCSLWMPEVYVENMEIMEPIVNVGAIGETRKKLVCYLCKVKYGACIRCSHGTCRTSFHPICARLANHRMEIWGKVGCDNVELRAFCLKHSVSQDTANAQQSERLKSADVDGDSSVAKLLPVTVSVNRFPKIKLACRNRSNSAVNEKSMKPQVEVSKSEIPSKPDSLPEASNVKPTKDMEMPRVAERDSNGDVNRPSSINIVSVLKKLIDQGKVNACQVASEMGISSDLFALILAEEHALVSSEVQLKIVKWLRSSAHLATSAQCLKFKNNSSVPTGSKAVSNDSPDAMMETDPVDPVTVPMKTLPASRRMKNNAKDSKDIKLLFPFGEKAQKNGNGLQVNDSSESPFASDDLQQDGTCNGSFSQKQNHIQKKLEIVEKQIPAETLDLAVANSSPKGQLPANEGNSAAMPKNVPNKQQEPQPLVEGISSFGFRKSEAYEADATDGNNCVKANEEHGGHVLCSRIQSMHDIRNEGPHGSSIHPFIKKRLMQVQNCVCFKQENVIPLDDDQKVERISSMIATICPHCQPWNSSCTDPTCAQDVTKRDNLDNEDKKKEILRHSPEDEVDGEILYFQNRLLDNAVRSKHLCEDLILRVVTNLPHELDALRQQRWDAVIAHQYICNLREEKKQGRKERRHQEAQAVLAAATAAAASSSRISSLRKDAHDESPVKVNTVSGRSPRAKETLSRLAVPRSEQSEVFQLTSDITKEQLRSCDICKRTETMLNPVLVCSSCKVSVHLGCYRNHKAAAGPWYCELCEELLLQSRSPRDLSANAGEVSSYVAQCHLCGGNNGAFRKSSDGLWVHAFCAEWLLESTFRRGQANPVEGMEAIAGERDLLVCCICCRKVGMCLKCNYGNCQSAFHPTCAKNAGFYMTVKMAGCRSQHKAYCEKHSLEQREKAEAQHHGVEELQCIKQMRVELEKVRLLCERIIKREKLKRELVLCSHDIMASKRDMVTFSMLARSSFYPPDVSSESVTTSLRGHTDDKKSGSEALQRSDDTTVDSIVSGKRRATLPHSDTDRKTDDSSTSRRPLMQKPTERVSFSGKQLPLRPPIVASRNTSDDGGKKSKSRKYTETLQKELVMTSDQAMTYNMMLPKGYAYVPRASLPTEKPVTCKTQSHGAESHEPSDPDG